MYSPDVTNDQRFYAINNLQATPPHSRQFHFTLPLQFHTFLGYVMCISSIFIRYYKT